MRDLSVKVSDRSVPRPVYQPDQQISDPSHPVSTRNAGGRVEVQSHQISHDEYSSPQRVPDCFLGIGSSDFPSNDASSGPSLEPILHEAPESSLSPPMHSPPRMSAEQRELKRQRDQARRDSKLSARIQRATLTQGELTHTSSISSMPTYTTTTTPTDISLLTEPTTSASQMVLPSYSPPLPANVIGLPSPYQQPQYMDYSYPPSAGAPLSSHYGPVSHDPAMMYSIPPLMQTGSAPHQHDHSHDNQASVRVVLSRPRPQCWEHGCNGRQFSTFSNLLRHQREKSGQAVKASYPDYGAEFNSTTARNGHLLHQKCRQRSTESPTVIKKGAQLRTVLEEVDMEHQGQHNGPSKPRLLMTPSGSPGTSVSGALPTTYRVIPPVVRQEYGEPMDSVSSPTFVKEALLSPNSEAVPSSVTSPQPTLTAKDELLAEHSGLVRAALVPDNTRGLAPEDTPCAMSDLSDEESFETSSGSEGPVSPNSLAESRRHILIDRTISWMISWVDSRLGVLAFQAHGTHGESHREFSRPQTKICGTTTGLTRENRKGRQKGGRGPGDEDSDGEDCVPPPPQVFVAADDDENLEFACPFLKHNSRKYQNIRSCAASGWKSIHRIKSASY